ncbi:MAG: tetratricopeptide repeat protein [Solobacterium sp.]|nr:tetratricopeptide repeat protein [Solobacterium sp.]
MMYRKLSVRWIVQPESLYRVFMVPEDMELQELGCLILTAFHVKEDPVFAFIDGEDTYECRPHAGMSTEGEDLCTEDLPAEFLFRINTFFPWEFQCRKTGRLTNRFTGDYVIDGAGTGIMDEEPDKVAAWIRNNDSFREDFEDLDIPKENFYLNNAYQSTQSTYAWEFLWEELLKRLDDAEEEEDDRLRVRTLKNAWKEFRRVCMDLRKENALPDTLRELAEETCGEGYDSEDFYDDVIGIIDDLFIEDKNTDVISSCRQMKELFPLDRETNSALLICLVSSLNRLRRYKEAMSHIEQALQNDPDDPIAQAMTIDTMIQSGRMDQAKKYAEKYRRPLEECDTSNLVLFMALQNYEEYVGNDEEAERIRRTVEEVRKELDDEDYQEEEDDLMGFLSGLAEDDEADPGEISMQIIDRFDEENNGALFAVAMASLMFLKEHDVPVISVPDEDDHLVRTFYTCSEAALRDRYTKQTTCTIQDILDELSLNEYAEVSIDPIGGEDRFTVPAEVFLEIMELDASSDDSSLMS